MNHSVHSKSFDWKETLHRIKHYLPDQAPLKDFIHHNTLHAFQHESFHKGLNLANQLFGYQVYLSLSEYQELFAQGKIKEEILDQVLQRRKIKDPTAIKKELFLPDNFSKPTEKPIGSLRKIWKSKLGITLEDLIQPLLFRVLGIYLDQGVSSADLPIRESGFWDTVRHWEDQSWNHLILHPEVRKDFIDGKWSTTDLLEKLVGDSSFYEDFLFDLQFEHPGWSGLISNIENNPNSLLDPRTITLEEMIRFELTLELDVITRKVGSTFPKVDEVVSAPMHYFKEVVASETNGLCSIWQEAYEFSFYDQVVGGMSFQKETPKGKKSFNFQAIFCIDDRECSLRRYVEAIDPQSQTWGTPGFFGVTFFYQPEGAAHFHKLCPAPVTPIHLIQEKNVHSKRFNDVHLKKHTHSIVLGFWASIWLGFQSAIRLTKQLFLPQKSPFTSSSADLMNPHSTLTVDSFGTTFQGLKIGFTPEEMTDRVFNFLKSIGLTENFAPLVYLVGHGATSTNNPHFSAYDCGACSGRPGSVNARVMSYFANKPEVRKALMDRGINIPQYCRFLGGLHDTTRDEIQFYDVNELSNELLALHQQNVETFSKALQKNAQERSRKFERVSPNWSSDTIFKKVQQRSISLFEPRPELNHATNCLCIIGRREITDHLFLDRRSFLNSYQPYDDPDGRFLEGIVNAAAPVCGGINLEYYFSRMDPHRLGAGTKLPHNVMGLIGVTNGIDGDLRPGLPTQMIEVHEPLRLMMIIDQFPEIVASVIHRNPATFEWFQNEWIHLIARNPDTGDFFIWQNDHFSSYQPLSYALPALPPTFFHREDSLPVSQLS